MLFARIEHVIGGSLREKERSFEIHGEEFVEAVSGRFKNIEPVTRSHAGVVHEKVDPAEFLGNEGEETFVSG